MYCAHVLIDGSSDMAYDYAIPLELSTKIIPGFRVEVSLRNRRVMGTVLALTHPSPEWENKLKPILRCIGAEPLISPIMMEMAQWVTQYYACSLEQVIRCMMPEQVRQESHGEKTRKFITLLKSPTSDDIKEIEKRAPKQASILAMLQWSQGAAPLSDLGSSDLLAPCKSLERKGWIRISDERVLRDPDAGQEFLASSPKTLNEEQALALKELISASASSHPIPFLLHGVTGSGKTEIYLQLVQHIIEQGKSALILVPEISLTPQTVQRFKSRFISLENKVAVLHSSLSQGERYDEWHRIRQGQAQIVIGARSAVFAPIQNLGVIIVDEEHDNSYKQESPPRYHGRDIAVLRGVKENALVVLGSATPSLESLLNVQKNKYKIVTLKKRVDNQIMPMIRLVDMRKEKEKNDKNAYTIISNKLRTGIEERLNKKEQIILFLNRRGFAKSIQCPDCGHVIMCPHCSLAMTYHKTDDRLICHLCGHQALAPRECPECHSSNILLQGYGTQKAEEIVSKIFPTARIARIDADISRTKNAVRRILNDFRAKKIDILLGTQMIAKGLDFPNVTLVGILNADMGLYIPEFRASERTFQLLTQVSGRAGRGSLVGEVIIQTCTPDAAAIQYARHHDCEGFSQQELEFRQVLNLPPYSHMLLITCRSEKESLAEFALKTIHRKLQEIIPSTYTMMDPVPSPIVKAYGQFRFQLLLKAPQARGLSTLVKNLLKTLKLPEEVTTVIDVDPYSFS